MFTAALLLLAVIALMVLAVTAVLAYGHLVGGAREVDVRAEQQATERRIDRLTRSALRQMHHAALRPPSE